MTAQHTLSFAIFDDLFPLYGPIHVSIKDLSWLEINKSVCEIASPFQSKQIKDPITYYFGTSYGYGPDFNQVDIVNNLHQDGYFVKNRYNKYYVVAWSIDYTRFEIFSKDKDKILVSWRSEDDKEDEKQGQIKGIINNENYNENPVITFMKELRQTQ